MSNTSLTPMPTPTQPANQGGFWNTLKNIPNDITKGISDIPVVGKAVSTAMSWAGKPLQEVTKDYKFIHSLYVDHGFGAALVGTLGTIAGAAIGTIAGPEGTALGASIGSMLSRQILGRAIPSYKDSFDKSNDPNYTVSFGRDLAHGLSNIPGLGTLKNTDTGLGQIVSGISDAAFDFSADPLAKAGSVTSKLRHGDGVAAAVETDELGNVVRNSEGMAVTKINPQTGKPMLRSTLPFASTAPGLNSFLTNKLSTKIITADQYDQFMSDSNVFSAPQRAARADIVKIATSNSTPVAAGLIESKYGAKQQWSRSFIAALSKITSEDQFDQIAKQSLYSAEFADRASAPTAELMLPSRTIAKQLSEKIGIDRIRNSEQATNYNDQVNLLLPRKSAIMQPVLNPDGTPVLNEQGIPQMTPKTRIVTNNTTGEQVEEQLWKINKPALFSKPGSGAMMNALAGKVRTFTNKRPMSYNMEDNKVSTELFDPADPRAGTTAMEMASLALPYRLALEHAGKMILAVDDGERLGVMHALQQEVLKNMGLADAQASTLYSNLKDASVGTGYDRSTYYVLKGQPGGAVELKPEYGDTPKSMAVTASQRYLGRMIDLKDTRTALREAKAYGALYTPVDDFFTHYTNLVFAPLTLLSTAFGLRVSSSEALQQIMRRGLHSYIGNVVANTVNRTANKYRDWYIEKLHDGLTETDKDAHETEQATGKPVTIQNNDVTDELDKQENILKRAAKAVDSKQSWNNVANSIVGNRYRVMPLGYLADKFKKSNLSTYLLGDKLKYMDERERFIGSTEPTAGVSAAHNADMEMRAKEDVDLYAKEKGHGSVPGENLAGLSAHDNKYHFYLAKNINNAASDLAQRDIAQDYLFRMENSSNFRKMSPDERFASLVDAQTKRIENPNMYKEYRTTMDGYSKAVPSSFAKAQVDNLQGLVHGNDGTINEAAIRKIAKGDTVSEKELKALPTNSLPIQVLGRHHMPTISDALSRVEQMGYRRFVTPVMDYISRQPLFNDFYIRRRMANQPLIDMGLTSPEEAVRLTMMQATREMLPVIHNPAVRSQWAVMHRNILPFFFAQEQALRRTGNLIMSNPQAFRDYQMIQQGMNNPGFVHTDSNGQKYIVYPGIGEFGNALTRGLNALGMQQFTGLPTSITGNTASLLSVLPEIKTPGVSPFINLALSQVAQRFPWLQNAANTATGGFLSKNWIDTIMPNSAMRDFFNAMSMDDRESTVYNSKLSAIAAAYYHGDLPENYASMPAYQQAQILAKIENNAKSNLIIKGLLSFFLPLAPTVSNDYYDKNLQTLRSDYLNLLKQKDPTTGQTYTAAAALAKFMEETGSPTNPHRGLAYTVARSQNNTSGAYVPLADSTITWINNNQSLLNNNKYSFAAPYLIPQVADSKDSLAVENKLLLDHFRSKVTSQDFLTALYVKQGWQDQAQNYADYQSAMTSARQAGNKQQEYQLSQLWKQVTAQYGQSNPVWYDNYNNPTRVVDAQKTVAQFQAMQQKNLIPDTPEGKGIKGLLQDYEAYHQGLLANMVNGQKLPGYSALQDSWYTYLDGLAVTNPRLQSVITGVFRRVN